MSTRTIENCKLIKRVSRDGSGEPLTKAGKCEGYQKHEYDDEPSEKCKKCKLFELYGVE